MVQEKITSLYILIQILIMMIKKLLQTINKKLFAVFVEILQKYLKMEALVVHKNEHSIGLNIKYILELENGILSDVKGSCSVERDSHARNGKNKTKGE